MRIAFCLAGLSLLTACTTIPTSSLLALRQLDPLSADMSEATVFVELPREIDVAAGSPVLTFGARKVATGADASLSLVLEQHPVRAEDKLPSGYPRPGFHIQAYRVAETDHARLEAVRRTIRRWKEADPDGVKGTLSVGVAGCLRGPLRAGAVPVSTFLALAPDQAPLPLTRDFDMRDTLEKAGLSPGAEASCPEGANGQAAGDQR